EPVRERASASDPSTNRRYGVLPGGPQGDYNGWMREAALLPVTPLVSAIARQGYALVPAATMQPLLAASGPLSDWAEFGASWEELALDAYMADGGRYRRRRHAVY